MANYIAPLNPTEPPTPPPGIPTPPPIETPYAELVALLSDLINITALGFGIIVCLLCVLIILKFYE